MAEHAIPYEAVLALIAADDEYATFTRPSGYQPLSEGRALNLLQAAASLITAAEAARLAEISRVIDGFFTHYGHSELPMFQVAQDLAHGIRQVLDRDKTSSDEEAPHG